MATKPSLHYDPIEVASRDEIEQLQLIRLKQTLGAAYNNVASTRARFDAAGVHPQDLQALTDIVKFPYTVKDDLRQAYPFGMFAVPRENLHRLHASSGTTGKPTVVGYTRKDLNNWAGLMARCLYAAGARPGQILHNAYGYGLFTGGLGFHDGAERLGMTCLPMSGGMTERQVQLINDFRPEVIGCTPSYLLAIADEFDRQGIDSRASSLTLSVHGAEPWTEAMRTEIERRFDIDALNHYGLSEIMGPGVCGECIETKDGLTIWEDHFFPEVIDPQTGEPLPDGEWGELVLTTLTKEALPMVRYRTRDLTRILPPSARSMRRMDRIAGRSDDMMIIRGVNVFPSQLETRILQFEALSPHYVLELGKDGPLDTLSVIIEPRENGMSESAQRETEQALASDIKARIGVSAVVRLVAVGEVERSAGKAQRIIDKRTG
jgi:phenylacetate-CoA ligase